MHLHDQRNPGSLDASGTKPDLQTELRRYQLTNVLDLDNRIKRDPQSGLPLINGANSSEILDILLQGLRGCSFLDPLRGELWHNIHGHGIQVAIEGLHKGNVVMFFHLDRSKVSGAGPDWPQQVLGVPIVYDFRDEAVAL